MAFIRASDQQLSELIQFLSYGDLAPVIYPTNLPADNEEIYLTLTARENKGAEEAKNTLNKFKSKVSSWVHLSGEILNESETYKISITNKEANQIIDKLHLFKQLRQMLPHIINQNQERKIETKPSPTSSTSDLFSYRKLSSSSKKPIEKADRLLLETKNGASDRKLNSSELTSVANALISLVSLEDPSLSLRIETFSEMKTLEDKLDKIDRAYGTVTVHKGGWVTSGMWQKHTGSPSINWHPRTDIGRMSSIDARNQEKIDFYSTILQHILVLKYKLKPDEINSTAVLEFCSQLISKENFVCHYPSEIVSFLKSTVKEIKNDNPSFLKTVLTSSLRDHHRY